MMTEFTKRFGLNLPLVLAPMAGGPSTPSLAAAVSNAGGLGSLGGAYLSPENLAREIQETKKKTARPFMVNLFVPTEDPVVDEISLHRALKVTKVYREELKLDKPTLKPPYSENFDLQFEAMVREKPAAFSFVFGTLDRKYLEECHRQGIYTLGTATTLEEALILQESGVDAVIAQGVEAGGHRAIFNSHQEDPQIGVLNLVSLIKDHMRVPVIAAGGIMNGASMKAMIAAGAQAVQLGTAFLLCEEAGTTKAFRQYLSDTQVRTTHLTRAFSGRIARGIENRFMMEMQKQETAILPFPAQNAFTRDIRNQAARLHRPEYLSLWAGEGVAQIRSLSVEELMKTLAAEYSAAKI